MDQHRQGDTLVLFGHTWAVTLFPAGARHSLYYRVYPFQMAGIGSKIDLHADLFAALKRPPGAQMVLHVACPAFITTAAVGNARRLIHAQKLGDNLFVRLAQDMRQHVQPARCAMPSIM